MSVVAELMNRITRRHREAQETRIADYAGLVKAVADEREVDEEEASQILEAAEKSPDDLAADVDALNARRALAKQIEAEPTLRKTLAEATIAADRLVAELESTRERIEREVKAHRETATRTRAALQQIETAKAQLLATAPAEVTAARKRLKATIMNFTTYLGTLRERLKQEAPEAIERAEQDLRERANGRWPDNSPAEMEKARERLRVAVEQRDTLEGQRQKAQTDIEELQRQLAEIDSQRLVA